MHIAQDLEVQGSEWPPSRPTIVDETSREQPHIPNVNTNKCTKKKNKKNTRANVKIASLNMRGRWHQSSDKWSHLNQIVREQKIGIIALQETHLSKADEDALNQVSGSRLHIILSIDPDQMNAKGIAIVLNKNIMDTSHVKTIELIQGRAILCTIKWHNEHKLTILTIYAPNDPTDNQRFWEEIAQSIKDHPRPDIMLGDFNLVEDPLDRLPPRQDTFNATSALTDLKLYLGLRDEWDISPSGIPTDHQMVSTKLSDKRLPYIGKGRWAMPLHVLKDKKLGEDILKLGKELHANISNSKTDRSEEYNPQTMFKEFKTKAIKLCRDTAKRSVPSQINKLNTQLKMSLNDTTIPEEERRIIGSHIQEKIDSLTRIQHEKARDNLMAKIRIESESATSKFWARLGKNQKPRDTIIELRKLDSTIEEPSYEK
ncbi:Endonuclease/exonuclease/phosphatase [Suillus subalutaceus]|uniref:Endonuclease/exonuclease/phosphatase n=1 Tax=Suillus subalutaceus TaxID=48586 RepID=UPI001B886784|nr:Endonuclease/exonuclease/phosphatase [Suillus subalutaceus]KAG1869342.1 Endonuclease/exonuclease/phosphatase [Suillus subalutaceus]